MFNPTAIKSAFIGLIGLRQNDNPDFPLLPANLLYTGSNMLVNHPLIDIQNISMTVRNYAFYNYPAWAIGTEYDAGERVKEGSIVYESVVDGNTGNQPSTSPDEWETVNLLALYLQDLFESAAEDLVDRVLTVEKSLRGEAKSILEQTRFYEGYGNLEDLIMNRDRLVGVMIEVKRRQNIVAIVESIGLQLSQANPNMKLYLFHPSQPTPIATITVNHTVVGGFQWHAQTNTLLYNLNSGYDAGGTFFLMYDQRALVGQAINRQMDFHIAPCSGCNYYNSGAYEKVSNYLYIRACHVELDDRNAGNVGDPDDMWDITKTRMDAGVNWGMNFDFSVKCDLTDFIVKQKSSFTFAYKSTVVVRLLEHMINSTRQNIIDEKTRMMANTALVSKDQGGQGLRDELERQIKKVDFQFTSLDATCMPCKNKSGMRFGSIGLAH